jgi:hypothetical protein
LYEGSKQMSGLNIAFQNPLELNSQQPVAENRASASQANPLKLPPGVNPAWLPAQQIAVAPTQVGDVVHPSNVRSEITAWGVKSWQVNYPGASKPLTMIAPNTPLPNIYLQLDNSFRGDPPSYINLGARIDNWKLVTQDGANQVIKQLLDQGKIYPEQIGLPITAKALLNQYGQSELDALRVFTENAARPNSKESLEEFGRLLKSVLSKSNGSRSDYREQAQIAYDSYFGKKFEQYQDNLNGKDPGAVIPVDQIKAEVNSYIALGKHYNLDLKFTVSRAKTILQLASFVGSSKYRGLNFEGAVNALVDKKWGSAVSEGLMSLLTPENAAQLGGQVLLKKALTQVLKNALERRGRDPRMAIPIVNAIFAIYGGIDDGIELGKATTSLYKIKDIYKSIKSGSYQDQYSPGLVISTAGKILDEIKKISESLGDIALGELVGNGLKFAGQVKKGLTTNSDAINDVNTLRDIRNSGRGQNGSDTLPADGSPKVLGFADVNKPTSPMRAVLEWVFLENFVARARTNSTYPWDGKPVVAGQVTVDGVPFQVTLELALDKKGNRSPNVLTVTTKNLSNGVENSYSARLDPKTLRFATAHGKGTDLPNDLAATLRGETPAKKSGGAGSTSNGQTAGGTTELHTQGKAAGQPKPYEGGHEQWGKDVQQSINNPNAIQKPYAILLATLINQWNKPDLLKQLISDTADGTGQPIYTKLPDGSQIDGMANTTVGKNGVRVYTFHLVDESGSSSSPKLGISLGPDGLLQIPKGAQVANPTKTDRNSGNAQNNTRVDARDGLTAALKNPYGEQGSPVTTTTEKPKTPALEPVIAREVDLIKQAAEDKALGRVSKARTLVEALDTLHRNAQANPEVAKVLLLLSQGKPYVAADGTSRKSTIDTDAKGNVIEVSGGNGVITVKITPPNGTPYGRSTGVNDKGLPQFKDSAARNAQAIKGSGSDNTQSNPVQSAQRPADFIKSNAITNPQHIAVLAQIEAAKLEPSFLAELKMGKTQPYNLSDANLTFTKVQGERGWEVVVHAELKAGGSFTTQLAFNTKTGQFGDGGIPKAVIDARQPKTDTTNPGGKTPVLVPQQVPLQQLITDMAGKGLEQQVKLVKDWVNRADNTQIKALGDLLRASDAGKKILQDPRIAGSLEGVVITRQAANTTSGIQGNLYGQANRNNPQTGFEFNMSGIDGKPGTGDGGIPAKPSARTPAVEPVNFDEIVSRQKRESWIEKVEAEALSINQALYRQRNQSPKDIEANRQQALKGINELTKVVEAAQKEGWTKLADSLGRDVQRYKDGLEQFNNHSSPQRQRQWTERIEAAALSINQALYRQRNQSPEEIQANRQQAIKGIEALTNIAEAARKGGWAKLAELAGDATQRYRDELERFDKSNPSITTPSNGNPTKSFGKGLYNDILFVPPQNGQFSVSNAVLQVFKTVENLRAFEFDVRAMSIEHQNILVLYLAGFDAKASVKKLNLPEATITQALAKGGPIETHLTPYIHVNDVNGVKGNNVRSLSDLADAINIARASSVSENRNFEKDPYHHVLFGPPQQGQLDLTNAVGRLFKNLSAYKIFEDNVRGMPVEHQNIVALYFAGFNAKASSVQLGIPELTIRTALEKNGPIEKRLAGSIGGRSLSDLVNAVSADRLGTSAGPISSAIPQDPPAARSATGNRDPASPTNYKLPARNEELMPATPADRRVSDWLTTTLKVDSKNPVVQRTAEILASKIDEMAVKNGTTSAKAFSDFSAQPATVQARVIASATISARIELDGSKASFNFRRAVDAVVQKITQVGDKDALSVARWLTDDPTWRNLTRTGDFVEPKTLQGAPYTQRPLDNKKRDEGVAQEAAQVAAVNPAMESLKTTSKDFWQLSQDHPALMERLVSRQGYASVELANADIRRAMHFFNDYQRVSRGKTELYALVYAPVNGKTHVSFGVSDVIRPNGTLVTSGEVSYATYKAANEDRPLESLGAQVVASYHSHPPTGVLFNPSIGVHASEADLKFLFLYSSEFGPKMYISQFGIHSIVGNDITLAETDLVLELNAKYLALTDGQQDVVRLGIWNGTEDPNKWVTLKVFGDKVDFPVNVVGARGGKEVRLLKQSNVINAPAGDAVIDYPSPVDGLKPITLTLNGKQVVIAPPKTNPPADTPRQSNGADSGVQAIVNPEQRLSTLDPKLSRLMRDAQLSDGINLKTVFEIANGNFNASEALVRLYADNFRLGDLPPNVQNRFYRAGIFREPTSAGKKILTELLPKDTPIEDYLRDCQAFNVDPLGLALITAVVADQSKRDVKTTVEMRNLVKRFPVLAEALDIVTAANLGAPDKNAGYSFNGTLGRKQSTFQVSVKWLGSGNQSTAYALSMTNTATKDTASVVVKVENSRNTFSRGLADNATVPYVTSKKAILLLQQDTALMQFMANAKVAFNPIIFATERSAKDRVLDAKGLNSNVSIVALVQNVDIDATSSLHRSDPSSAAARRVLKAVEERLDRALGGLVPQLGMRLVLDTVKMDNFVVLNNGEILIIDPFLRR